MRPPHPRRRIGVSWKKALEKAPLLGSISFHADEPAGRSIACGAPVSSVDRPGSARTARVRRMRRFHRARDIAAGDPARARTGAEELSADRGPCRTPQRAAAHPATRRNPRHSHSPPIRRGLPALQATNSSTAPAEVIQNGNAQSLGREPQGESTPRCAESNYAHIGELFRPGLMRRHRKDSTTLGNGVPHGYHSLYGVPSSDFLSLLLRTSKMPGSV